MRDNDCFPFVMHKKSNERNTQQRKEKEIKMMKLLNEDRISNLPDSILLQILSLINIKIAVQTSLFSKRWRYLWRSLSNLDFDYSSFPFSCSTHASPHFCYIQQYNCNRNCKLPFFINFVTHFLSHRDHLSNISILRLASPDHSITLSLVENCVNYAIAHNVQQLDMSAYFDGPKPFQFPPRFFTCQSLTVLKLKDFHEGLLIPKPFCLSHLKNLYLEWFSFRDEDNSFCFDANPFLGFPKLESLALRNCQVSNLIINAPTLRVLDIIFYGHRPMFSSESKIVISTPRLAVFKFEGQVSLNCSIDELPSLVNVYVDLWTCFEEPYTDEVKKIMPLNLVKMLGQLQYAKSVSLSMDTIEVLAMDPDFLKSQPPPFCNLEHLKFVTRRTHVLNPRKFTPTTLPCYVMTYLTQGSSHRDTIVVEIPKE